MTLFSIQVHCRQFEVQLLARDSTSDVQLQRVRQLYHRQLLVPHADADQTMQSYLQWEASLPGAQQHKVPQHVEQGFQKAQQAVSIRSEHEAMVAAGKPADENLLAAFLAYIKYEEVCSTSTLYFMHNHAQMAYLEASRRLQCCMMLSRTPGLGHFSFQCTQQMMFAY